MTPGGHRDGGPPRRRGGERPRTERGARSRRQSTRTRSPGAIDDIGGDQVEGRRAVRELLAVGRRQVRLVWMAAGLDPSPQLDEIEALAARRHVRVETVSRSRLDAAARTDAAQGVLAYARPVAPVPLEQLCGDGSTPPFLLVVAGITDPRNLGSMLRSAECAGVTGIVLPRHRAAHLSPTVAKVAAGAIEHLAFAVVGGIPAALEQVSRRGVWTLGLAPEAGRSLYDMDLADEPVALVVGSEEKGLAPLVRRRCDELVAIPQHGALESLNAAVAAAVACFEIARRRVPAGARPAARRAGAPGGPRRTQ